MNYTEEGYIDLSWIGKDFRKAMQKGMLVPNDLCGPSYHGYWIYEGDSTYFLKIPNSYSLTKEETLKRIYTELLAEELATIVGLNVIETKVATLNKKRPSLAMISRSYLRDGYETISGADIAMEYLTFLEKSQDPLTKQNLLFEYFEERTVDDLLHHSFKKYEYNSLEFIWASLLYHFRYSKNKLSQVSSIMQKLTKRYIFSFIMMQQDYHLKNWEIQENESSAFLSPMYDLDLGLKEKFDSKKNNSMRSYMDSFSSVYEDFERFYTSSSDEVKKEVEKQMSLLNPEAIFQSMKIIEDKYPYVFPDELKEMFLKIQGAHFEELKSITKNYHL